MTGFLSEPEPSSPLYLPTSPPGSARVPLCVNLLELDLLTPVDQCYSIQIFCQVILRRAFLNVYYLIYI